VEALRGAVGKAGHGTEDWLGVRIVAFHEHKTLHAEPGDGAGNCVRLFLALVSDINDGFERLTRMLTLDQIERLDDLRFALSSIDTAHQSAHLAGVTSPG